MNCDQATDEFKRLVEGQDMNDPIGTHNHVHKCKSCRRVLIAILDQEGQKALMWKMSMQVAKKMVQKKTTHGRILRLVGVIIIICVYFLMK